jgi:hypothetical protein
MHSFEVSCFAANCDLDAQEFDRPFASNAVAQEGKSGVGSQRSAHACRADSRWAFHLQSPVRESSSHLAWIRMDFICGWKPRRRVMQS